MRYFGESDISAEQRVVEWKLWDFYHTDSSSEDITKAGAVRVTIAGQETLDKAKALLSEIPGGTVRALKSAVRSAERTLRKNSAKDIQGRYDITERNIRTSQNVTVRYSIGNGVQATIRFAGERIPLHRFGGAYPQVPTPDTSERVPVPVPVSVPGGLLLKFRFVHHGIPAKGHVLKSTSPTQFETAFVGQMTGQKGNKHIGIFDRTGGVTSNKIKGYNTIYGVDELREFLGPSVAQMVGNQEVAEKLTREAYESFEKELDDAVYRILTGWR